MNEQFYFLQKTIIFSLMQTELFQIDLSWNLMQVSYSRFSLNIVQNWSKEYYFSFLICSNDC